MVGTIVFNGVKCLKTFCTEEAAEVLFTLILHTSTVQNIELGKTMNIKLKINKKY